MTEPPIRTVREVEVFRNQFVLVRNDDVEFADGSPGTYIRIGHPSWLPSVAVLARDHADRVGLVYIYRYPIAEWEWGLPRGMGQSSDPAESARAELREELGVEAESLEPLGTINPDSGMQFTRLEAFLARVDSTDAVPLDVHEVSAIRWVDPDELRELILSGEMRDGITLSVLALATAQGRWP